MAWECNEKVSGSGYSDKNTGEIARGNNHNDILTYTAKLRVMTTRVPWDLLNVYLYGMCSIIGMCVFLDDRGI